jgi:hypothetical protein
LSRMRVPREESPIPRRTKISPLTRRNGFFFCRDLLARFPGDGLPLFARVASCG